MMVETQKEVAKIGARMSYELAGKMIKDYSDEFPLEAGMEFRIGKDILMAILLQPGCKGIALVLAKDENGNKTLVYVGVDEENYHLLEVSYMNEVGDFVTKPGIVADRSSGSWPTTTGPVWHW